MKENQLVLSHETIEIVKHEAIEMVKMLMGSDLTREEAKQQITMQNIL